MTAPGPIRLIVTDIDGTLTTTAQEITPRVRQAVAAARARGVRTCVATGRAWRSGRRYIEALPADPPAILFNGGLVYEFSRDRVLFRQGMDPELALVVVEALDAHPDLAAHLYVGDRIYVRRWTPLVAATALHDHLDPEAVGDLRTVLPRDRAVPIMKFRILGPREELEALAETLGRTGPVNCVFSETTSLEVLPPGVSKGTALRVVAEHLGVDLEAVMAVGDELNDLTMLQAAGWGVAMADAPEPVRRAARVVAPTSDADGLAVVIERYVLDGR